MIKQVLKYVLKDTTDMLMIMDANKFTNPNLMMNGGKINSGKK